jgi:superoxide dismutase, Cu-Zn family
MTEAFGCGMQATANWGRSTMKLCHLAFAALAAPLALQGCVVVPVPGETVLTAPLVGSDGREIGTVRMTAAANGVMMRVQAAGLPPGLHGAHVHAVGHCNLPDFTMAGPHWDLSGHSHGRLNPLGPHDGDLGNFSVAPDGRLDAEVLIAGAVLPVKGATGGPKVLADADGASLVIHAGVDDERTDPAGNSGARSACARLALPLSP